ncbi:MAG: murein biosynthesis integral membrane protein MurJ [Acidobacteria bacterium]|nr:murein biosynthesis integral membrane protein MurJ [Acidobacteriota bacterium]
MRSAGIVSIAVLLSRVSGLVREISMARLFGASLQHDSFLLGFRIPNLTRDLFAEGALSSAFIPIFSEYLATRSREEAARLANLVATALILFIGLFCVAGVIWSPQLVGWMVPGFSAVPGKHELAVHMTRIMFPFLLLVALAAQAMGILNACQQFGVPALSSSFFNLGSVVFGLLIGLVFGPSLGITGIEGMAWGVVAGGALQLGWQIPALHRAGFRFRPAFDWSHPGLREIIRLMGPAILGNAAVQINVWINTNFASSISDPLRGPDGPVTWLNCAFRFMQLPLGVFGVAIASATLPEISRSASAGDMDEFRQTIARSLGMVFLLTVPSSVGLVVLGDAMIGAIYQGGRFNAYDTQQTGIALSYFALGLAGYAAAKVLNPAFYALKDSRTPMLVTVSSVIVNLVAINSLTRVTRLGHASLAATTSVVALVSFLILFLILRARIGGVHGRALASSSGKILAASAMMGVAVYAGNHAITNWLGESRAARLLDLAVCIPGGAVAFYAACRWMEVPEVEMARRAMLRRRARV